MPTPHHSHFDELALTRLLCGLKRSSRLFSGRVVRLELRFRQMRSKHLNCTSPRGEVQFSDEELLLKTLEKENNVKAAQRIIESIHNANTH